MWIACCVCRWGRAYCHSASPGLLRIARACSISSIEMNSSTETFCVTDMLSACDLEFSKILDLDRSSRSCRARCRSCRPCALFGRPRRPTRTCLPHLCMIVPCLGIYFTLWVKYIKIPASSKNHENQAHARVNRKWRAIKDPTRAWTRDAKDSGATNQAYLVPHLQARRSPPSPPDSWTAKFKRG